MRSAGAAAIYRALRGVGSVSESPVLVLHSNAEPAGSPGALSGGAVRGCRNSKEPVDAVAAAISQVEENKVAKSRRVDGPRGRSARKGGETCGRDVGDDPPARPLRHRLGNPTKQYGKRESLKRGKYTPGRLSRRLIRSRDWHSYT